MHFKEDLRKILKDPPNLADMLANSPHVISEVFTGARSHFRGNRSF